MHDSARRIAAEASARAALLRAGDLLDDARAYLIAVSATLDYSADERAAARISMYDALLSYWTALEVYAHARAERVRGAAEVSR